MDMFFSRYNYLINRDGKAYIYNSLSNSLLEVDPELFNMLSEYNPGDIIDLDLPEELKSYFIASTESEESFVINNLKLKRMINRFDKTFMSLTICPTSSCNFACTYCFEGEHPNVFMSDETALKLMEFVKCNDSLKTLRIMWFGGEPLLNLNRIISLTQSFTEICDDYSAGIITNGYLLNKETLELLGTLKIDYIQVTLDGTEEVHNLRRPHISGQNSFRTIVRNIDTFCESGSKANLNVRVNIDKDNLSSFDELYDFFKSRYLCNNVTLSPEYVSDLGIGCKRHCVLNREERARFRLEHSSKLNFYPEFQRHDCMARQMNSFVVDADGSLYKCYNDIGNIDRAIGNLHNKGINAELLTSYLMDADIYDDFECKNCGVLPICGGGCPYLRIKSKNEKTLSREFCELIKGFEVDFILSHLNKQEENI